jgi:hypothetical protein
MRQALEFVAIEGAEPADQGHPAKARQALAGEVVGMDVSPNAKGATLDKPRPC